MNLKEFIEKFLVKNTLIRLWYPIKGGHKQVIDGGKPQMEWEITKGEYSDHKVIGVTDILVDDMPYIEAVNIVIEEK